MEQCIFSAKKRNIYR